MLSIKHKRPVYYFTEDEVNEYKARLLELEQEVRALEGMRPIWAQGWTTDGIAAQCSAGALRELWDMLGANDQTDACERLRNIIKAKQP